MQLRVGLLDVDQPPRSGIVHTGHGVEILPLQAVRIGEAHEGHDCGKRPGKNEGRPPAESRTAAVGDRAEQRQKKQRQHIVQRHDDAGGSLRQAEFIGQNQWDRGVVCLPEGADQKKRKSDIHGAPVIQLHGILSPFSLFFIITYSA